MPSVPYILNQIYLVYQSLYTFFFYYYYYYSSRIRLYGFCSSDNDRVKDAVSAVAAGSTLDQFGTRFSVVFFVVVLLLFLLLLLALFYYYFCFSLIFQK